MSTVAANKRARRVLWRLFRPFRLGVLRRTRPLSEDWGYDRGHPVDRYYVDRFVARHRADIRGRVLEVKDSRYTRRFGQDVTAADVIDIVGDNPRATIVADLAAADAVPSNTFDCCVITQTLQYLYDLPAAVGHLRRILKPGGVLLVTVPGFTRLSTPQAGYPDFWRFTPASCARLFGAAFGPEQVTVEGHGNVLSSIAFLAGMAQEELAPADLDAHDPRYPLIVTVRALKP